MAQVQYYGTGRRKKSVARVRLVPGGGKIIINNKDLDAYFGMDTLKAEVRRPLERTGTLQKFDVLAKVEGGGFTGQAGVQAWYCRALLEADDEYRPVLKGRVPHKDPE